MSNVFQHPNLMMEFAKFLMQKERGSVMVLVGHGCLLRVLLVPSQNRSVRFGNFFFSSNFFFLFFDKKNICFLKASFQSSQWILCGEQDESSCSSSSTAPFSYLGCQWRSVSRPCSGKEECESAGECSDSHFLHLLGSGETAGCLSAGIFPISTSESQFPLPSFGFNETLDSPLGFLLSLEAIDNEEDCLERADFEGAFIWVEGAKSEEECVKRELGKYGCKLPQSIFSILFLYDEEECECAGGTFLPAWRFLFSFFEYISRKRRI